MTNCHHFGGFLDVFGKDWIDHGWFWVNFRFWHTRNPGISGTMKFGWVLHIVGWSKPVVTGRHESMSSSPSPPGLLQSPGRRRLRRRRYGVAWAPGAVEEEHGVWRGASDHCGDSWRMGGFMGCHGNIRNNMEMQISSDFRFVWQQEILGKIMIKHGCLLKNTRLDQVRSSWGPFEWETLLISTVIYSQKWVTLNLMQPVSSLHMAMRPSDEDHQGSPFRSCRAERQLGWDEFIIGKPRGITIYQGFLKWDIPPQPHGFQ